MPFVRGGKFERGTSNFFEFLTCSLLLSGRRFILDIIPLHPFSKIDKLIEESLAKTKKKIKIDIVYLDRGFNSARIINALKRSDVKFLMPQIKTSTVKAWFDKSEGCNSRVIENFQIGWKEKAFVNLILVDDDKGIKRAFISNWKIASPIAYRLYKMYSKRWGIEISYKKLKHDFRPKTTSRNYNIRLFYFLFSACLFNLWVLVNISLGLLLYGRVPEKPILSANVFTTILYHVQENYFDPGG